MKQNSIKIQEVNVPASSDRYARFDAKIGKEQYMIAINYDNNIIAGGEVQLKLDKKRKNPWYNALLYYKNCKTWVDVVLYPDVRSGGINVETHLYGGLEALIGHLHALNTSKIKLFSTQLMTNELSESLKKHSISSVIFQGLNAKVLTIYKNKVCTWLITGGERIGNVWVLYGAYIDKKNRCTFGQIPLSTLEANGMQRVIHVNGTGLDWVYNM